MNLGLKLLWKALWAYVLAVAVVGCLHAQDITGNWQGTITPPQGKPLRMILQIANDGGALKARIYSIDQGFTGDWTDSFAMQDSTVKFVVGMVGLSYKGKLNPDGNTISGTWTQRGGGTPFTFRKATRETAWSIPADPTPHTVQFITVQPSVKLEVLDWGGSGRPLVFLPALGDTAHAFDSFAPKFTGKYHVFGITPRGFGDSSYPTPSRGNYSADRLGDDVLAVMGALHLNKPVLISHSIGGEQLSSIGSRYPEKVSGLIYLESSGYYMHYDSALGDTQLDLLDTRDKIERILPDDPTGSKEPIEALLATMPQLEKDLRAELKMKQDIPSLPENSAPRASSDPATQGAFAAIFNGEQKYTKIPVPILAFFAVPHDGTLPSDAAHHAAAVAFELKRSTDMANAFEADVPSAKVIRIPNANHYIFRSNEAEVLRVMNEFLDTLPQS